MERNKKELNSQSKSAFSTKDQTIPNFIQNSQFNSNNNNNNNNLSYEDLRHKLTLLESDNQRINEELFSLQNKFYVQTKILNDKSLELSKEVSNNQKIKSENDKILKDSQEMLKKIEEIKNENEKLKNENLKYKNDFNNINNKFEENNNKSNY